MILKQLCSPMLKTYHTAKLLQASSLIP